MKQKFCQECGRVQPHIEVQGSDHTSCLACTHCLEVGQPGPVMAFSPRWDELVAKLVTI